MVLSVNPYSPTYTYGSLYPISKSTSGNLSAIGNHSANSSFFAKYVLHSKPYEQYIKTAATGIANFLKAARNMQESAQHLLQKNDSPFQARTVKSSDSAKVAATAAAGAAGKTYDVKVNALAAAQKNSGTLLSGSDASVADHGLNAFNITVGGKTTKVSVFIHEDDTNDQALTRLRDAINAAKTGVTASIVTDKESGKKRLELSADKTGTDSAFQVEDVTGNAMSTTGAANVTQQAANASYSVNGGPAQTSQSNTIELEQGKVTATLHAVTDEAVSIEVKPDTGRIIAQVKDLVAGYNEMYRRLREADGIMNAAVRRSLDAIVGSATYERIGIIRNGDGTLRLDEKQLEKSLSANFDWTAKAIGGNLGLADRLSSAAARYNEVPASSLLNQKARQVQQFALYQASLQLVMPPQTSGWMFNLLY
jgi:flagellar capping protein FliD